MTSNTHPNIRKILLIVSFLIASALLIARCSSTPHVKFIGVQAGGTLTEFGPTQTYSPTAYTVAFSDGISHLNSHSATLTSKDGTNTILISEPADTVHFIPEPTDGWVYEVVFEGEPNTTYILTVESPQDNFHEHVSTIEFTTPSERGATAKEVRQRFEEEFSAYVQKEIIPNLLEDLKPQNDYGEINPIWQNSSPYYNPTDKELEAIVDAYVDTFIRNWKDFNIIDYYAHYGSYEVVVTDNWPRPDMEQLNKQIDDRENQLKLEVNGDYKKLYQIIVKELPDMIRNLDTIEPPIKDEEKNFINIKREPYKPNNKSNSNEEFDYWSAYPLKSTLLELYP